MNAIRVQIHLKYFCDENSSKQFHNFWYAFEPSKLLTVKDILEDIQLNYLKDQEKCDERTFIIHLDECQLLPFTSSQILRDNDRLILMPLTAHKLHQKSFQDSINFNISSSTAIEPSVIKADNNHKQRQDLESTRQDMLTESTIAIEPSMITSEDNHKRRQRLESNEQSMSTESTITIIPSIIKSENNHKRRQRLESNEQSMSTESTITIIPSVEIVNEQPRKKKTKEKSSADQVINIPIIQCIPEPPVTQSIPKSPLVQPVVQKPKEPIIEQEINSELPLSLPSTNGYIRELKSKTPAWKAQKPLPKGNVKDKSHVRFDSDSDDESLSQTSDKIEEISTSTITEEMNTSNTIEEKNTSNINEEKDTTNPLPLVNGSNSSVRIQYIPTPVATDVIKDSTKTNNNNNNKKKTIDLLFEMKQHKTVEENQAKKIRQQLGKKRAQHKKRALEYMSMANFVDQAFGLDKNDLENQIASNGNHSSSSSPQTLPTSFNKLARLPLVAEAIENNEKIYDLYPPITQCPTIQTRIAFKLLELSEDFCPKMSEFKEGTVIDVNETTGELTIQLDKPLQSAFNQPSKFYAPSDELLEQQEEESTTTDYYVIKICKHLLDNADRVSVKKDIMAHIALNNNGNNTTPFMDRLSHAVIKETSKNLKHYMDVKRRENAFILNPNSSALDPVPSKARYMYGTTKEYPPPYGSSYSDNDIKIYMRSFQQQRKQINPTVNTPEKRMCRQELTFHMRPNRSSSKENQKFAELNLRPSVRASSACSATNTREFRRDIPKPAFKLSRVEQNRLIDNTANILATMINTRRSIYETSFLSQQMPHTYVSRNTNPSPRPIDEQSNIQSVLPSVSRLSIDSGASINNQQPVKQKRKTKNPVEKARSIMNKAKPISKAILCEYKVSITTGNCNGASTDAPISIQFYGTNGYTPSLNLINSENHRMPFQKDQTDIFTIQTYHVGQLAGIRIGHDQKDIQSAWFLNKVSIFDPIREITSDITCNAWLSSKSNDQKTTRDFPVNLMVSHREQIDSDEHREFVDSQSDFSTTTELTTSSNSTNRSQDNQLIKHKRTKKHHKQRRVSIGPTTVAKRSTPPTTHTNHSSQTPPVTKNESPPSSPPSMVPKRRVPSPIILSTSSSDTEIEEAAANRSSSSSATTTPTFDKSDIKRTSAHKISPTTNDTFTQDLVDYGRPAARLEKHHSPIPVSHKSPIKNKEKEGDDFFD
ncbi:unnamed protein product [Adineta steineri]|uniref:PLAT domain-containing protein n=1 Tax=Adineta steineri TaxID=433720 RepID=A0A815M3U8_9BILA|nr:unnamed protein product [Adineta steineri]CAF1618869.1 unnamed protein product [Adineta steineri]